jgi:pimeloyl-ACP methyl ester carboxylesterase
MNSRFSAKKLGPFCLFLLLTTGAVANQSREIVRFANDGLTFVGDLYLPPGAGPHPAIVFMHGSDRGERSKPGWEQFAELFLAEGIAVLVFDKRGVGDSEGVYRESPPLEVPARDGLGAIRLLKARSDIDSVRIGIWGASQGGWVGPLMATLSPDVAFVISLSGPGVSPLQQSLYQRMWELVDDGFAIDDARTFTAVREKIWKYFQTGEGREAALAALLAVSNEEWFSQTGWDTQLPTADSLSPRSLAWFREHATYDPLPVAKSVQVPVLHIYGAKDRHIPVEASVGALRGAYASGDNSDVTFRIFPEGGHGLQIVQAERECLKNCVGQLDGQPVPGYHKLMVEWLENRGMTGSR